MSIGGLLLFSPTACNSGCLVSVHILLTLILSARHRAHTRVPPGETTQSSILMLYPAEIPSFLGDVQFFHSGSEVALVGQGGSDH